MISFIAPNQERYNAQTELQVTHGVNGEKSLSGVIHTNNEVLRDLDRGWRLEVEGEIYVVTFAVPKDYGSVIETEFDAVHEFFYDFAHDVIYEELNGSNTFNAYMDFIFQDSGYSYRNETSAYALNRQNFGNESRLSLFNKIIQDSGVEFNLSGRVVRIVNRVGTDLTTKVEKSFNMNELRLEKNINNFVTYMRGYGAWNDDDDHSKGRLVVEYESPLVAEYGRIHAEPVFDERYSVESNLYERLKAHVDNSYTISVQLGMEDLTKAGYQYQQPRTGDWIMAINRDLDFQQKIRIVSYTSHYSVYGDLLSHKVTCNSIGAVQKLESNTAGMATQIRELERQTAQNEGEIIRMVVNSQGTGRLFHGNVDPMTQYEIREGDVWFDNSQEQTIIKNWNGAEWVPTLNAQDIYNQIQTAKDSAQTANENAQKSIDEIEATLDGTGETTLKNLFARMIKDEDFETLFYQEADSIGITYNEGGVRKAIIAIQDGLPYIMGEHIILDGNTIVDGSFTVSEEMIAPEAIIDRLIAQGIDAQDVTIVNLNADSIVGGQLDLSKGIKIGNGGNSVLEINEQGEVILNVSKLTIGVRDIEQELERISEFEDGKSAYELAVENGFVGTEQDYLDSLKGQDGNDGNDGISIKNVVLEYVISTSDSIAPTSGWSTTRPTRQVGEFLWVREKVTYSDNSTDYVGERVVTGDKGDSGLDGEDGKGITTSDVSYQNHTNGTTAPTGNWSSTPNPVKGQYLWTRNITNYTDGSEVETYSVSYNATDGQNGDDGTGIESSEVRYQQSSSGSTTPSGTWQTSIPSPVKGKYLWTRTITEYTDGTNSTAYSTSYYATDGQDGEDGTDGTDGVGVTSSTVTYQNHTSGSSTPTGTWQSTVPTPVKGRYLWTRTVTNYSDASEVTTYSVSYYATDGKDGQDGQPGTDGTGIASTQVRYQLHTNGKTAPTGTWLSDIPTPIKGRYLWTRTVLTFTDGGTSTAYSTAYYATDGQNGTDGTDGTDGKDGVGVTSAKVTYQNHTNGQTAPTGSWVTTVPTPVKGRYLWTRTITNYSDGSDITTYSVSYYATDGQNGKDGTDGTDGTDGVGLTGTEVRYQQSTSGNTTPTGSWLTTVPTPTKGRYLWTRTILSFSDGTKATSYSTSYYATDGKNGNDGISVSSIVEEYYKSSSPTQLSGGSWSTTVPPWNESSYIWTRTRVTYSNGQNTLTDPISISGRSGDDGLPNYTWVKYAPVKSPTSAQMSDNPTGQVYRGVAYNKTTPTESSTPSHYTWEPMYDIEKLNEVLNDVNEFRQLITVKDTRNDNYSPSHYANTYADYMVQERKLNSAVGVPSENTHGILVSYYTDGLVEQTFSSNGEMFTRSGNVATDTWSEWTTSETVAGAQAKADFSFEGATEYALGQAQDVEANAKNYTDSLVDDINTTLGEQSDTLVQLESDLEYTTSQWLTTFTASGGVNEIRNSVGYAELEFWTGTGNVTTIQNAELETYGSGSAFILGASSSIEQDVIGESGHRVFSVIVEKNASSTGSIQIEHDGGTELISINSGELNFVRYDLPFEIAGSNYKLRLETDTGSEILFTNIMVNYGEERQRWGFANDELYGTTFRMNRNGFRVYHLDGQQYTAMTPDEFAGYAIVGGVWQRTFALNGDTTEMRKWKAEESGQIGRAVQLWVESDTSHGLAIVRGDN